MPGIRDITKIIESTPQDQPVCLVAPHGVGKSEFITEHFTRKGYRVETKFLGQMADEGDLSGFPYKEMQGKTMKMFFAEPFWWPKHDEKFVLFLDELNRAKPELRQCVMDLVLNKMLNGRRLPKDSYIIAAINPSHESGYYDVDDLDPALIDRFNTYEFQPNIDEWLDWAVVKKVHSTVLSFIAKNNALLFTDIKSAKSGDVNPSPRSWKRVSDFMNKLGDVNDIKFIKTWCGGIVGLAATSHFVRHLKENDRGITAGKVITNWNPSIEKKLKDINISDTVILNREIILWMNNHENEVKSSKRLAEQYSTNLKSYLDTINQEAAGQFWSVIINKSDEIQWPRYLMSGNTKLSEKILEILQSSED